MSDVGLDALPFWGKTVGNCSVAGRTQRADRVIWLDFRLHLLRLVSKIGRRFLHSCFGPLKMLDSACRVLRACSSTGAGVCHKASMTSSPLPYSSCSAWLI